ncbi:hypothetical protein EYC84_002076 [Monilinia fructicola]|uniref:Uncharacterized protein n=1 Tax=Monilinia fructicola TaxID=38448 RepID=A0A5M9JRN6_MONFR|nr:hypothetical protein EYC84_002076 [Monilinia fructicola]
MDVVCALVQDLATVFPPAHQRRVSHLHSQPPIQTKAVTQFPYPPSVTTLIKIRGHTHSPGDTSPNPKIHHIVHPPPALDLTSPISIHPSHTLPLVHSHPTP